MQRHAIQGKCLTLLISAGNWCLSEAEAGCGAENMRREGFEFSVSPPLVLYQNRDGARHEPIEEVVCEVEDAFAGPVIEVLTQRKVLPWQRLVLCRAAVVCACCRWCSPIIRYPALLHWRTHHPAFQHE